MKFMSEISTFEIENTFASLALLLGLHVHGLQLQVPALQVAELCVFARMLL